MLSWPMHNNLENLTETIGVELNTYMQNYNRFKITVIGNQSVLQWMLNHQTIMLLLHFCSNCSQHTAYGVSKYQSHWYDVNEFNWTDKDVKNDID